MTRPLDSRISRRDLLVTAAAGATLALPHTRSWAAAPALDPILRAVPSSGERLPVIGVGTNAFGVTDAQEIADRKSVLQNLALQGGKVIDTARGYGTSEEVIGTLVAELGNRDRLFLATKTPTGGDYSGGKAVLDESFRRLKVERIDLLQFHNLGGIDQLMPHFQEYKRAGKIRYIGVSTSTDNQYPQMLETMRKHAFDFIQVDYSIDNRSSADAILPLARDRGMAVLINVPFGGRRGSLFGRLAGKPVPEWAQEFDAATWAQYMLKYIISHPAVTVVIPGTTNLAHLEDNQRGGRGRLPNAAQRKRMEEHWATI